MKKQKVEKLSELTKSEGTGQSSPSQKNSLFQVKKKADIPEKIANMLTKTLKRIVSLKF